MIQKIKKNIFFFVCCLARDAVESGFYFEGEAITSNRIDVSRLSKRIDIREEEVICADSPPRSPVGNNINFRPITPVTKPAARALLSKRKRLEIEGGKNSKKSKQI